MNHDQTRNSMHYQLLIIYYKSYYTYRYDGIPFAIEFRLNIRCPATKQVIGMDNTIRAPCLKTATYNSEQLLQIVQTDNPTEAYTGYQCKLTTTESVVVHPDVTTSFQANQISCTSNSNSRRLAIAASIKHRKIREISIFNEWFNATIARKNPVSDRGQNKIIAKSYVKRDICRTTWK